MTQRRFSRALLPFAFLCAVTLGAVSGLTACGDGGGGDTGGTDGACFGYDGFDKESPTVTFKTDVLPILRNSCGVSASCHGSETPPTPAQHYFGPAKSDPDPTADQIALILESVGKASEMNPDMKIIEASKPEASFLMYKLDMPVGGPACSDLTCESDKSCGSEMPQGGPQLPLDSRNVIRRWIAQGAKND